MALQLNKPRKVYKEFYGRNVDKMPELIEQGFTPLPMMEVMERRLDVLGSTPDVRGSWWENYFDTADAIVYHPDGRIKVVLDSQTAREINPKSTLKNNALVLPNGAYEQLQGTEFSKEDVAKYAKGESLTLKQVLSNPIWNALARDPKLLEEYAKATFREAKSKYQSEKNMGVYTSNFKEVPNLRLWLLGGLSDDLDDDSYADGNGILGLSARLVGVAPEAQGAEKIVTPSLDQIMKAGSKFIAPVNMEAYRKELAPLYKN